MLRALSAALLLAASTAAANASPAVASLWDSPDESVAAEISASVAAWLVAQVEAKAGNIGPQIDNLALELDRSQRDAARLRRELHYLLVRVRRYKRENGKPDPDPTLRWDLQRFNHDLASLARNLQRHLNDLRYLIAQAEKDPNLVPPAQRLTVVVSRLKDEANRLALDARFGYFDCIRAGFTHEAMNLNSHSRDADSRAQDLHNEADRLLAKVRGSTA